MENLSMFNDIIKIINNLLLDTSFNIVFRPYPANRNALKTLDINNTYKNNPRFKFDTSEDYSEIYSKSICMIGSGSSYNAALLAKNLFLKHSGLRIEAIMASELSSSPELIPKNSTVLAISQSGESADVLESVRIAKKKNCKIISMVNVMNCSLALESSIVIGLNCGPEIGVAATKSFTSQIVVFLKIIGEISKTLFSFEEISNGILELLSDCLYNQKFRKFYYYFF